MKMMMTIAMNLQDLKVWMNVKRNESLLNLLVFILGEVHQEEL